MSFDKIKTSMCLAGALGIKITTYFYVSWHLFASVGTEIAKLQHKQ